MFNLLTVKALATPYSIACVLLPVQPPKANALLQPHSQHYPELIYSKLFGVLS